MRKLFLFGLVFFLALAMPIHAETIVLSPSAEITDNNLIIHEPNRYFDEDLSQWIYADITDIIKMNFDYSTGNIKYSYKNDKYYIIARLFFVINVTQTTCNNQGWDWFDNHCFLWWSQARQFMQNNNISFDVVISEKNSWTWKYALNLSSIPQNYMDKLIYIGLHLEDASPNLSWNDVVIKDGRVVVKNKISLGYSDLIESGFTLSLYDKRTVLIGNVKNKTNLWLDPDLTLDGTSDSLGGNLNYTTVRIINGGTLNVNATGWINITATNITIDSTSKINANGVGNAGGSATSCAYGEGKNGPIGNGIGNGTGGGFENSGGGAGFGGMGGNASGGGVYSNGIGGTTYGSLTSLTGFMGSGGGAGGCHALTSTASGGAGGTGGGLIILNATNIIISGNITATGGTGGNGGGGGGSDWGGGGGGGSGGEIMLIGNNIYFSGARLNTTSGVGGQGANGGSLGGYGGNGGGGRIKVFYQNMLSGLPIVDVSGNQSGTFYVQSLYNCTSGNIYLTFKGYNEETSTLINYNLDLDVTFNILNISGTSSFGVQYRGNNTYNICSFSPDSTYYVTATGKYWNDSYSTRYYFLQNATLTNSTQNINLYLLGNSSSSFITMEILDQTESPQSDVVVLVQKQNIGTGTYTQVAEAKSDFSGNAYTYLKLHENYKFFLTKNGIVLREYEPMQLETTTLTFHINLAEIPEYFSYYDRVATSCSYSNSTSLLTCNYLDTSGLTMTMRFNVTRIGIVGETIFCSNSSSSSSATFTCNLTGNYTYKYSLIGTHDSINYLWQSGYIDLVSGGVSFGSVGLFLALMLCMFLPLVGLYDMRIAVIMEGVAIAFSIFSGLIVLTVDTMALIFSTALIVGIIAWKVKT